MNTIDTMLTAWGAKVDAALWKSLNQLFTKHNLTVKPFNDGNEFVANVIGFIDDEIQNANQRTEAARFQDYSVFVDSVWNGELTATWMPLLQSNSIVTEAQFGQIKAKSRCVAFVCRTRTHDVVYHYCTCCSCRSPAAIPENEKNAEAAGDVTTSTKDTKKHEEFWKSVDPLIASWS